MKKGFLILSFCLSLLVISSQPTDVIHHKNGFDIRGTITNRTENHIQLLMGNGKMFTFI